MGRVEHRQERGARLFLYPSLWEPLFAWSIHHNDRNPQTHLLLLSSYPLFLLSLHSATLCFSAYFTVESRPTAVIELIRLYIEASHTEIAYWLTITKHAQLTLATSSNTHKHTQCYVAPPLPQGLFFLAQVLWSSLHCHKQFICPWLVSIDPWGLGIVISSVYTIKSQYRTRTHTFQKENAHMHSGL